jgi:asparagine synthase (glutamine-hydrolysing)
MCGIAGIIAPKNSIVQLSYLQKMATALHHRGPDGEGFWINENNTIGFAHRRLSIVDLSDLAAQPFYYLHFTITFNGEIYNYIELKAFLSQKGFTFSTKSDTEVILAAYCFWGKDCLHHFDGMFAFAIYDSIQNEVFIARDHFGEKPLYYFILNQNANSFDAFYFASEMKALWAIGIEKNINHHQLLNYLTLGYTSNPTNKSQTFFNNIQLLQPGHYLLIRNYGLQFTNWKEEKQKSSSQFATTNLQMPNNNVDIFSSLLSTAIDKRLRSDVAVGTSLSGGLDSSSIVANIHQLSQIGNYKSQTFTASFPNFGQDETQYSKAVAGYFNLQQDIVCPTANNLVDNFEKLMYHQEEPLQSASVFTQFMVYKLAKEKGITVLLDGQGADEVLGGYKKYAHWFLQELLRTNLAKFKQEKALLFTNEFLETWNYKNYFAAFFPSFTAKKLQKKAIHQQNINAFINKEYLHEYQNVNALQKPVIKALQDILNYNTNIFGLDELLRYADRNSMANSTEVRLPFLNVQLVNFVATLPSSYKINDGFTKWILRESVKNKLPKEIVWRKGKIGYEPPQQSWMLHPEMKKIIIQARQKLVEQQVLNNKVLNESIIAKPAHETNNFDWWILCAAQLFK